MDREVVNTEGLDYEARDSADPLAWRYVSPLRRRAIQSIVCSDGITVMLPNYC